MSLSARSQLSRDFQTEYQVTEKITDSLGYSTYKTYTRGRFLGKGGFARVYELTSHDNRKVYASKVISKSTLTKSRARQKLMSEIKIHKSLHHQNIVKFEHFFEDSENVYIMLELCTNQTLSELIRRRKRLTELEVQCYMIQIIKALKYLHQNRIIHRDIKLVNLFLTDKMEIKVGDFGLATKLEFDSEKKMTICGTPNYIAPEILDGHGHSYEVDIWSLGVVLYACLIGKPPFETNNVKTTYSRIRTNSYSFPDHIPLSRQARSLIEVILLSDPGKRPSLDEILQSDFLNTGYEIPKAPPASTIAVPPSEKFLSKYRHNENNILKPSNNQRPLIQRQKSANNMNIDRIQNRGYATDRVRGSQDLDQNARKSHTTGYSSISYQGKDDPKVWILKWVDYSSKYGLGYILSNGSVGVFFNDSTKIIVSPQNNQEFYYIERNQEKVDMAKLYNFTNYPTTIQKKITLLNHFNTFLTSKLTDRPFSPSTNQIPPPYLKKWMRTRRAILFRFSNKVVQVNFQDTTELILDSETRVVNFSDRYGVRQNIPLSIAMNNRNEDMAKRLQYTKDILSYMLGPKPTEKNAVKS